MTAAYNSLNVPGLAAGGSYLDPQTGVRVYKITSSSFPANAGWTHDYAEGGDEVSLPLNSSGTRAVVIYSGFQHWLIDFTPGVGVSNPRNLASYPFNPFTDGCVAFSSNPATPYYLYVSTGAVIHRVDVRSMTEVTGGGWPVTGETDAVWVHQTENDTFFIWMRGGNGSTIVGYEPATGTKKTYTNSNLNEPRIDRDPNNRSVCISMNTPQNQALFWDWRSNSITWSSPLWPGANAGEPPVAHQASLHGYWVGVDWNVSPPLPFWKISATPNSVVNPLPGGASGGGGHCNGNWNQHPANADDQWFACYVYGTLAPPSSERDVAPGGILLATASGQRRILAHLYNTATDYGSYSFVKLSSDGAYALFTSNMNGSSRRDLFLATMPTTNSPPPPPDTTPPSVSVTAPANGATVSGPVTVTANASDNVGVAGVQFQLDGANLNAEDTVGPYSASWDTTSAANGSHTLSAIARDAAGNRATSSVSVTVSNTPDTTPPTVPAGLTATAVSSVQINLSWSASTDSQSGMAGYKIYRGGTQIGTSTSTSYSNTGLTASTTYTYTVAAYDVAGNTSSQSASASATTQAPAPPPTSGIIAFLRLDENAGATTFADASGSNNNGSCSGGGCPAAGVAGKVGTALSFNGTSSLVTILSNSGLNAFPLTVSAWFKTSSTTGVVGLVNKYVAGSYDGYNVFLNNGNVCAWYNKDASNFVYDNSGCTFNIPGFNDNAWHQVVYVVDASGGKLYLDGAQRGSLGWTGVSGPPTTTQDVHLGHYPGAFGGVEYFSGSLDQVRIYNTALTATDVTALYSADNSGPPADSTPPAVSITAPANGATVSGTINSTANASDNVGVVGVQFQLDGANLGAEDTSAPYAATWNTTTSTNGSHTLTAVARDAAGNRATSSSISVTVSNVVADTTPPTVSVTAPADGATVSSTVNVTAIASDNVGVVGVQFQLDGANLNAEDTNTPYSTTWDTRTSNNGTHTLTAVARDAAGNRTTSSLVTVTVSNTTPDTTPPTVTITAPAGGATVSATINVTANATDGTGVVGVQFQLDGANLNAEDTTSPYATSWNTTTATNASHTLTAIARDAAGNRATSSSVVVTVSNAAADTTPPTVPTGLTANPVSSSQINLSWTSCTDSQSGMAGYKISRGGAQIATSTTTSYSDTGLSPSTTYTYTVAAYDVAGNTSQATSASAMTQALPPPPGGGIIAFLHLDESAGATTFIDSTGNGNDGSCSGAGCPAAGVAGKVGTALSFDGVSNLVTIPSNSGLNAFPLTVAAWFKTSSTSGVVGLVSKYVANAYNGYNVFMNNGNVCAWYDKDRFNYVYDGGGCTFNIPGFNDNAWHQVVYVVDASGGKLYLDGVQRGSLGWTGVAGAPTTSQEIHLGHYPKAFGGAEYFNGSLDQVRIYNSALSASEVSALYSADNSSPTPADTTPPTVAITAPANGATVSATINVTANSADNVGVVGVQFQLDGANLNGEDTSAPYATSWNTTASLNGSHTLTAVARDAAGNRTTSSAIVVTVSNVTPDTTPPAVPTGLAATAVSSTQITLSWSASSDSQSGMAGYKIYRGGTQIGTSTSTTYADGGLAPSTTYTYTVAAYDVAGNTSAQSTSASATTQAPPPPPTTGGIIAFLHLDESAGATTFTDASGHGNHGVCGGTDCPTAGVAGRVGTALSFDGVGNVVTIPSNTDLNAFPLTVAAWFKTSSTNGVVGLVNKYVAGSYDGYNVFLNNGNVCAWYNKDASNYVYDGGGCTFNIAGFNDNAWHQVAFVVDASGGRLYLDGVQRGATQPWTGVAGAPTTTQDVHLGHYPGAFGGAEYFSGSLDQVRIYNTALTASEIGALFSADNPPPPPPPPADTTPPAVTITAPASGATVSAAINVAANASDNAGVAGVQFQLDGVNLGAESTSAPYATSWNTTTSTNGSHTLTAVARDAAGNRSTSSPVTVTVSNSTAADATPPIVVVTAPGNGATVSSIVSMSADATDNVAVIGVQFAVDGANLGAEDTSAPYTASWDSTTAVNGTHTIVALARDAAGNITTSAVVTVTVSNTTGETPFKALALPGRIEAEDFDRGGEGVSYHDKTPKNQGGYYRDTEDVDIINPYANGYVVDDVESGEWLKYTVSVGQAGTYKIQVLVSSIASGGRFHIEVDGVDVTGAQNVMSTGSWGSFTWIGPSGIKLNKGSHVLKFVADQESFNVDSISAALESSAPGKSRATRH